MYQEALRKYGSIRKAAQVLNLTKSKFMVLYKKELGLCTGTTGCQNLPEPGKTRCKLHLESAKRKDIERGREYNKKWRQQNRELNNENIKKWNKENPDKRRSITKKYSQTENGKISSKLRGQRRRTLNKQDIALSIQEVNEIFSKFEHKCFKCGSTERPELDHHIPLSKGGKLSKDNVVILCKSCNSGKCDKMPELFYTKEELEQLDILLKSYVEDITVENNE